MKKAQKQKGERILFAQPRGVSISSPEQNNKTHITNFPLHPAT
jgi:hypothetical protein